MSDKDHGAKIQTVASHLPGLMDLKVWLYKIMYMYNILLNMLYYILFYWICLGIFSYVTNWYECMFK